VTPAGVIAIDQNVFELLFKATAAVLEAIPEWVGAIADHLPLAGDGAALLEEKALKSSRLRRRLRAIYERGATSPMLTSSASAHTSANWSSRRATSSPGTSSSSTKPTL